MPVDPLSEVLALAAARCAITGGFRAGGDWAIRFAPDAPFKLDAVLRGSCWLLVDGRAPTHLQAGDAVVFNGLAEAVLCSAPGVVPVDPTTLEHPFPDGFAHAGHGEDVEVIGGHVAFAPGAEGLLAAALPEVVVAAAPTAEAAAMRRLLGAIVEEAAAGRPGASFATDQHAQLLLLEVLRTGLRRDVLEHPTWLRLLADPQLRPAVALMHGDPARAWGLAELGAAVGMSRSHFAHRFRAVAGQPPGTYLTQWRIRLAEQALRTSDTTVAALADRLGYATESSFSHAFTRVAGVPPGRYRREAAAAPAA